jgi:hypothetical protein
MGDALHPNEQKATTKAVSRLAEVRHFGTSTAPSLGQDATTE